MAIIAKGPNLQKGIEVEFTLNITDLLAHESVSGDAYFSTQSNWDKVFVNYTSEGNQKQILIFENVDSGTSDSANFGVLSEARDVFEVQSIVVMDKQGGYLKIKRDLLTVEDFDVDFSSAPSDVTTVNWNYSGTDYDFSDGGLKGDGSPTNVTVFGTNQATGSCYIEFTPQSSAASNSNRVGIAMTATVESTNPSSVLTHSLAFGQASNLVTVNSNSSFDLNILNTTTTYAGDGTEVFRVEVFTDRVEYSKNGVVFFTDDQSKTGDLDGALAGYPPYFPFIYINNGSWELSDIKISGFDEE